MRTLGRTNSVDRLSILEEELGWQYNAVFTSIAIKRDRDAWLVVLKAVFPSGPLVSFLNVRSFADATETVQIYARSGLLQWKEDDYPVKWTRRS